jgi:hypothetical protein
MEELDDDVTEDFLDVDKPIQGQNYCCISFVSPEKVLARKEDYYFNQFFKKRMQILNKKFDEKFEKLLEGGTETVDSALVSKLHKRFLRETIEAADKCMEDFADFKYSNERLLRITFTKRMLCKHQFVVLKLEVPITLFAKLKFVLKFFNVWIPHFIFL